MGYGFFEPRIVYGFVEIDQTKLICRDFLEEHEINFRCCRQLPLHPNLQQVSAEAELPKHEPMRASCRKCT